MYSSSIIIATLLFKKAKHELITTSNNDNNDNDWMSIPYVSNIMPRFIEQVHDVWEPQFLWRIGVVTSFVERHGSCAHLVCRQSAEEAQKRAEPFVQTRVQPKQLYELVFRKASRPLRALWPCACTNQDLVLCNTRAARCMSGPTPSQDHAQTAARVPKGWLILFPTLPRAKHRFLLSDNHRMKFKMPWKGNPN